jgi:hypothetical protein
MRGGIFAAGAFLVVSGICLLVGCGGGEVVEGPETVPVKGKVEFTKGGKVQSLAGAVAVEFQSVEKPELLALGEILEDGTFTLATQVEGKGKPGVVPGTHRVRLNADESIERYVSRKFLKHETSGITVKVPVEGELIIKVWK